MPFIFLRKEGSPFFMFSPETCFGCTDWNLIPEGVSYEIAKEALRLAAQKLPITTKFVVRRDYDIQNQNA